MLRSGAVRQYVAAFTACFSVVVSGSCFGWVTPILEYLLSPQSEIPMTASQSSWMVAIVELGNLLSPVPASFMADRWGRRASLLSTAPLYLVSWALILSWPSILVLYFARVMQGIAMGIVFTVVPLYLSEIASVELRGSVSSLFHNSWYLGHLIEYCLGPFFSYRTYTFITACLPVVFYVMFYPQPESPYFLIMKKKESEAAQALRRLRGSSSSTSVDEELQAMIQSVNSEMGNQASWMDIFKDPADRKALGIVLGLGTLRVLNGLIAIMTYSTQTFAHIHFPNSTDNSNISRLVTPNNITILIGVVLFVSSFFVTLIVNLSGRKPLLMFSGLGASFFLFLSGSYFFLDAKTNIDVSRYYWFPVLSTIIFSLFVTLGLGPISVMYQSEMFLSNTRGIASSFSNINLMINAFFVLKFYQVVVDSFGVFVIFWLFSSFCILGLIWISISVPEIKGKSFVEIRQDLSSSMQKKENSLKKNKLKTEVVPVIEVSDIPL